MAVISSLFGLFVFLNALDALPPWAVPATMDDIHRIDTAQAHDDAFRANYNLMNLNVRLAGIEAALADDPTNQLLIELKADLDRQIRDQMAAYAAAIERATER